MRSLLLLSTLLLAACLPDTSVLSPFKQQKAALEAIKEATGMEAAIGFKSENGILTSVTIQFADEDAGDVPYRDLKQKVDKAITDSFDQKPRKVVIAFSYTPK